MAGLDLSVSGDVARYRGENGVARSYKSQLSPGDNIVNIMDTTPCKTATRNDYSPMSTPRKNKRKSSSPKRRASDFSIKRFCPETAAHALNFDSEDISSRPGYGEHPPSTPETSASSSTPSPPDVGTELRIPQAQRYSTGSSRVTSPQRQRMTSPSSSLHHARSPATIAEQTIPRAHLLPPYAMGSVMGSAMATNPAFMAMNPLLIQHMVGLQQHGGLPLMLHPQLSSATASQLPVAQHPSAQARAQHTAHLQSRSQQQQQQHTSGVNNNNHYSHAASKHHNAPASQSSKQTHPPSAKPHAKSVPNSRSRTNPNKSLDTSQEMSKSNNSSTLLSSSALSEPSTLQSDNEDYDEMDPGKRRKNYKNMTRERRIEANARERSRVHTISAAFETLRHTVPSFSHNQRLSKLAILRIACSYISSLSTLAGNEYSNGDKKSQESFEESVNQCTKTIQNEGRAKRRH